MLDDLVGAIPAQQPVAVLGELAQTAIDLPVPVGKSRSMGQIFRLIDKSAAQATRIHLLQANQVVGAKQGDQAIQVVQALPMGQNMLPTLGDVVPVAPGVDPGLDVVAQDVEPMR